MNYSEPLLRQLTDALSFVGVGFLLGVLYTVCGFFRRLSGGGKKATFALDLLFCFLSFACLFGASLALQNGVWRLPSLLAAGAGFFAFQQTAGRLLTPPLGALAAFLRAALERLFSPVRRLSARLWAHGAAAFRRRREARNVKAAAQAVSREKTAKKDCKKSKKTRKNTCKTSIIQV